MRLALFFFLKMRLASEGTKHPLIALFGKVRRDEPEQEIQLLQKAKNMLHEGRKVWTIN
jgi:hypothetical protein